MFTGLIVTVLEYSSPEPLVSVMVTYGPFIVSGGLLVHVRAISKSASSMDITKAVQVMINSVPWYTVSSVLRETETAGAGTEENTYRAQR